MKKALVVAVGLSTLLLGACEGTKTEATIVILDDNGKEAERFQVDDYSNRGDGETVYWIKDEAHYLKNTSHKVITKKVKDDDDE